MGKKPKNSIHRAPPPPVQQKKKDQKLRMVQFFVPEEIYYEIKDRPNKLIDAYLACKRMKEQLELYKKRD